MQFPPAIALGPACYPERPLSAINVGPSLVYTAIDMRAARELFSGLAETEFRARIENAFRISLDSFNEHDHFNLVKQVAGWGNYFASKH